MCLARMPYDPKASLTDQWTLTANPGVLAHDTLLALVSKYGPTSAQIFSRYLTQIDITPFNGTTSQIHMREDMAIFEFELTRSECDAVARLLL